MPNQVPNAKKFGEDIRDNARMLYAGIQLAFLQQSAVKPEILQDFLKLLVEFHAAKSLGDIACFITKLAEELRDELDLKPGADATAAVLAQVGLDGIEEAHKIRPRLDNIYELIVPKKSNPKGA